MQNGGGFFFAPFLKSKNQYLRRENRALRILFGGSFFLKNFLEREIEKRGARRRKKKGGVFFAN